MAKKSAVLALVLPILASAAHACDVLVNIENGQICGSLRPDGAGKPYASFRGVPYAKQPLGELRFKELQPAEPIEGILNATTEGPVCPQKFVFFQKVQASQGMSESCIHANIHVPFDKLPSRRSSEDSAGLPILVVVQGGAFHFGSGDADIYGPEYLVTKDVIVISFNYRTNFFGFFSLGTAEVPGNQALRDIITLLRWVQRNGAAFGGDTSNVTLFGFSSGGVLAHFTTLSAVPDIDSLFQRVILVSGTAFPGFHTEAPSATKKIADSILPSLGITATDPKQIHKELCELPLEKIMNATWYLEVGICFFFPVVEASYPGVTRIIDENPLTLMSQGRGKNKPLLIGFTNNEMYTFVPDLDSIQLVPAIQQNHTLLTPTNLFYWGSNEEIQEAVHSIEKEYFEDGSVTEDGYLRYTSDLFFKHPAARAALSRVQVGGAPVFFYEFSYHGDHSPIKEAYNIDFVGAGHGEDVTNFFKMNARIPNNVASFPAKNKDDQMREWMTGFVSNFMRCSNPTCKGDKAAEWPASEATSPDQLHYQAISEPQKYHYTKAPQEFERMVEFLDSLQPRASPKKSLGGGKPGSYQGRERNGNGHIKVLQSIESMLLKILEKLLSKFTF